MTTASKCLVILTTVASLVFFTFISVGTFAGPNYADQMREKDLATPYVFSSTTTAEGVSYSVETRRKFPAKTTPGAAPVFQKVRVILNTRNNTPDTPILPEVVLATRKHLKKLQETELKEIELKITDLQQKKNLAVAARKADLLALESRLKELSDVLDSINNDFIKLTQNGTQVELDSVRTLKESDRRRQEVSQVEQQLKEILTHHDVNIEQQKESDILLVRLTGTVARLEKRRQQLLARGAKIVDPITAKTKTKSKSVGER